jgi:hypothetical protein
MHAMTMSISFEEATLSPINRRLELHQISKEEAETEAVKQGFIFEKPSAVFDPSTVARWTPLQAIAAIGFDASAVHDVSDECRRLMVCWTES